MRAAPPITGVGHFSVVAELYPSFLQMHYVARRTGDTAAQSVRWGYRTSPFQAMPRGKFAITGAIVQLAADSEAPARLV